MGFKTASVHLYEVALACVELLQYRYGNGLIAVFALTLTVETAASAFVLCGQEVGGWPLLMLGALVVYVGYCQRKRDKLATELS